MQERQMFLFLRCHFKESWHLLCGSMATYGSVFYIGLRLRRWEHLLLHSGPLTTSGWGRAVHKERGIFPNLSKMSQCSLSYKFSSGWEESRMVCVYQEIQCHSFQNSVLRETIPCPVNTLFSHSLLKFSATTAVKSWKVEVVLWRVILGHRVAVPMEG